MHVQAVSEILNASILCDWDLAFWFHWIRGLWRSLFAGHGHHATPFARYAGNFQRLRGGSSVPLIHSRARIRIEIGVLQNSPSIVLHLPFDE